jgi:hypothetical protein
MKTNLKLELTREEAEDLYSDLANLSNYEIIKCDWILKDLEIYIENDEKLSTHNKNIL